MLDHLPPAGARASATPQASGVARGWPRLALLLLLPLAVVALGVLGVSSRLQAHAALVAQADAGSVLHVVTATAALSADGEELVLPGSVQAQSEAPIYARTSGYLKTWNSDIGAAVKRGQLLAEIDAPELDQQLLQAKAELATAQATYTVAHSTDARWQGLLATRSVSLQDAEEKAGDAAAKQAAVASAAANVARLNELESFKRVLAPFDGVITARATDVGALIGAGQNAGAALFHVADTRSLRVYVDVPENDAAASRPGLKATLHFAEFPGRRYNAVAVRTAQALDPAARTLRVELALDNRQGQLFPGAYVEVHFKLPVDAASLRVPANTVLFRSAGPQVATLEATPNGMQRVKLKNIVQGRDFGATIEVLSGLSAGEAVVLNPPDSLIDGMRVTALARPAAAGKDQP